ncbi:hypothetical protein ACN20G_28385 (plasmid) [Streptomyces sp. BI20]|uniref:hypothetical protein n=1 Tax=Streptomyces sp. BI20 TaxID=3403460 RepID=UPI003C794A2D
MNDGQSPDPAGTVAKIERLLARTGLDRADHLAPASLADRAGLTRDEVELLLEGASPPERTAGEYAVERLRRLIRTPRPRPDGTVRPYTLPEIAAATAISRNGLAKALERPSWSNLEHLEPLAEFFDVPLERLVDSPRRALDRVLRAVHTELLERVLGEPEAAGEEDRGLRRLSDRFQVVGMAARGVPVAEKLLDVIGDVLRTAEEERARERAPEGRGRTPGPA